MLLYYLRLHVRKRGLEWTSSKHTEYLGRSVHQEKWLVMPATPRRHIEPSSPPCCGTPAIKETRHNAVQSPGNTNGSTFMKSSQKEVATRSIAQAGRENPRFTNLRLHTHALTDSNARNPWAYILTLFARTCVSVVERQMALLNAVTSRTRAGGRPR